MAAYVYVLVEAFEADRRLVAIRPDAGPLVVSSGEADTPSSRRAMGELLPYVHGADAVVTWGRDTLSERLSDPAVLGQARDCLRRLVDAQLAALLVTPQHPEFSLESACSEYGLDAPMVADPDSFRERWEALTRALRARARAMPDLARGLVASMAGPSWPRPILGEPDAMPSPGRALQGSLPRRPRRARQDPVPPPDDLEEASARALSPDGVVAREHPAYEHRPGQVEMAREVAGAFAREECLLVEAGTGTGKSLAYLVPAILHARSTGAPVIISTNTLNLQDQLIERDIPLAGRALELDFQATVVKGRSNYICPRLLASAASRIEGSIFEQDRLAVAYLAAWAMQAEVADLSAIPAAAYDLCDGLRSAVRQVRARSESCSGRSCAYFQTCPVEVVRAHAQNADIVVANHALLLAAAGTPVLPDAKHIVVDEAHNLEDVATDQLGREVTSSSTRQLLRLLAGEGSEPIDARCVDWLGSQPAEDVEILADLGSILAGPVAGLEYALEDLASAVLDFLDEQHGRRGPRSGRDDVRLTSDARGGESWEAVSAELPTARGAIEAVRAALAALTEAVGAASEEPDDTGVGLLLDLEQRRNLLFDLAETLAIIIEGESDKEYVCWASTWQARSGDTAWGLRAAPIDVGPALNEAIYEDASTVVMTSATLTVENSFDYLRQRIGLHTQVDRLLELVVPSSFDFMQQLLMCIPEDLPVPGGTEFDRAAQEAIFHAAVSAGGGTLCLFTSRAAMTKAFEALRVSLEGRGLTPLCQDVTGTRTALLDAFREDPTAVLFGLKSFWEGIDVPGDALRCLVIHKLPFAVPSDPVIQARQERVEDQGLDGYNDFYVPNAIIGFRQGVGRLIRTRTDRGVVFVLDRRVLLRRYGERFLRSVPPCAMMREPLIYCVGQAKGFLRPDARE